MKWFLVFTVLLLIPGSFLFGGWGPHVQITVDNIFSNGYQNATNGQYVYVNYSDNSVGNLELFTQRSTDYGATWEPRVQQTSNFAVTYEGMICARDSFVHVVFPDYRCGAGWENGELYYIRSTDAGNTWAAEERITFATSTSGCGDMQFTGSNIYVAFHDWRSGGGYPRLYWMSSDDYGASWSSDEELDGAECWYSNLAADGSTCHLVWNRRYPLSSEVIYMNSTNGGGNWSSDVMLSQDDGVNSGSPRVIMHGDTVIVCWIEGFDIFCRRSFDGGSSFEAEMNITNSAEWENGLDVGFDGTGKIHMVTRELYMSIRYEDLYSYSTDCGITWLGDTTITDEAGTTYMGHLTVESNGSLHFTWRDDRDGDIEIYYCGFPSSVSSHPPIAPYIYARRIIAVPPPPRPDTVFVHWSPVTEDTLGNPLTIDHYSIYGSNNPSFVPGAANFIADINDTFYKEPVPSYGTNNYYLVFATATTGKTSIKSNMGYAFWKSFVEKPLTTDKNWASIPWHSEYTHVSDLTTDLSPDGNPLIQITNLRDDQFFESWTWDDVFLMWTGTDYLRQPGNGYEMVALVDTMLLLIGSNGPDSVVQLNANPSVTDKNWVSIPYNAIYNNVSGLTDEYSPNGNPLVQITNLRDDQYYESWTWDDVFNVWGGTNFAIETGKGYEFVTDRDTVWNPSEYGNKAGILFADNNGKKQMGIEIYNGKQTAKRQYHSPGISHTLRWHIDEPGLKNVRFTLYHSGHSNDVLKETTVGSYIMSSGVKTSIGCNVGNFNIPWKIDEEVVLEISGMKGGISYRAKASFVLDGGEDIQDLGTVTLQVSDGEGAMGSIGIGIPQECSLTAYPNPIVRNATVWFAVPQSGHVRITVYDVAGRCVSELVNNGVVSGYHTVRLDGNSLSSGIYYIRMQTKGFTEIQKLIIMK